MPGLQADCMTFLRLLLVCLPHSYSIVEFMLIQLPGIAHDQYFHQLNLLWSIDGVNVTSWTGVNWYGSHAWWLVCVNMLFRIQHGAMVCCTAAHLVL